MAAESPIALIYGYNGSTYVETTIRAGIAVPSGQPGFIALGSDGTNTRYLSMDSNGRVNLNNITGTISLPTNAATESTLSTLALNSTLAKLTIAQGASLGSNTQALIGGSVTTAAPSYTNGQISPLSLTPAGLLRVETTSSGSSQVEGRAASGDTAVGNPVLIGGIETSTVRSIAVDSSGRIITAPAGASSSLSGFSAGYVTTNTTTKASVRATTYTEQTSNAQRSLVSASANDTSAGTGARTVKITYYTSSNTGPFTETVTMNGTTPVNTVATDICYIEKLEVLTVGSGGSNAGIITLRAATGGGGAVVWTIAANDNRTFGAHHYVASGKTAYITGMSVGHNGTTTGSGGLFVIQAQTLPVGNNVDAQVSDFIRLYGQAMGVPRVYGPPLVVVGPARITAYVTPEGSGTVIYRCAFDFYEQNT